MITDISVYIEAFLVNSDFVTLSLMKGLWFKRLIPNNSSGVGKYMFIVVSKLITLSESWGNL